MDHIVDKTNLASNLWSLPIRSALVCTFIYPDALEYAKSLDIPVVISSKQFVPIKLSELYLEIKEAFGSYYIESARLDEPPEYLRELIEERILWHIYAD